MNKHDEDKLAELIESSGMAESMEKRIDEFSESKERAARIQRARRQSDEFQAQFSSEAMEQRKQSGIPLELLEEERELDIPNFGKKNRRAEPIEEVTLIQESPLISPDIQNDSSGTRSFDNDAYVPGPSDEDGMTKAVDLDHFDDLENPEEQEKDNSRFYQYGLYALAAILVIGLALGGYFLFSSMSQPTVVENENTYQAVLKWAQDYDTYTDEQKKQIVQWESRYNQLNDTQKKEINDILMSKTGFTFEQLLTQAKQNTDEDNDNVEIAEKKAKLRDEIAELTNEMNDLIAQRDALSGDVDAAQAALNAAQASLSSAQSIYDQSVAQRDQTQGEINQLQADITANNRALADINAQLAQISSTSDSEYQALIAQQQQIQNELAAQQSELNSLNTQLPGYQNNVTQNEASLSSAQADVDSAQADLDAAQASFDRQTASLNNQIDRLQHQIDSKNAQLEKLDQNNR